MIRPGMMQPQGGSGPQGMMMPQAMHPGMQGGIQYMQCVLPMEQAMQLAQTRSVVPIQQIPASQVPALMQQQGGKGGFGGAPKGGGAFPAGGWGNQGFGFPNHGGGGGFSQKPKDDDQLDDWLAKRMAKTDSSSAAAGQNESDSQKIKPKQHAQSVHPQQHQPMPQQTGQGQPQMHQQHMQLQMQQQQQQFQQQWQWQQQQQQQQQQWQWQQQQQHQQQQHQPQLPSLQMHGLQSQTNFTGKGWADSPRTAAWRQKMAEAAPTGQISVDEWASKREKALADAPKQRPRPVATSATKPRDEDEGEPLQPIIPMEQLAHVFADARPWAEISDEDKANEMWGLERADVLASSSLAAVQESPATAPVPKQAAASSQAAPAAKAPAAASEPAPAAVATPAAAASQPAPPVPAASAALSADKRKKALQKKLRQIAELEERQTKGETLNKEELAKIGSKASIEAEMAEL
eukprot:TRINITY_DN11135_c5_g1_i1.p1 TRINITY_DN11135_c5_g1~~TRINITY_DN11135_c5_g1_i1.p1  ORF type:complete len:462 (+),score=141.78 TRINITY_DN11135_c5_g1_i1:85-1470(+)